MQTAILILHILAAVSVVILVLLQHGKGADMGAAFGSGSAGSLFGSAGAANFLSRSTGVLAAVFFATSLGLTYFSTSPAKSGGVTSGLEAPKGDAKDAAKPAPAAPVVPAEGKSQEIPK